MRKAGIKSRRTSPGVGFFASPNMDCIISFPGLSEHAFAISVRSG